MLCWEVPVTPTKYKGRGVEVSRQICFCRDGDLQPSSSGLPCCSRIWSSPSFLWWLEVGIHWSSWILRIRVFRHHLQLCFNGFDLGGDTQVGLNGLSAGGGLQADGEDLVVLVVIVPLYLGMCPSYHQLLGQSQLAIETLDGLLRFLLGLKVNKTVAPRLTLQGTGLVEEEVELLHCAELLQELEKVVFCDFGVQVANP